MQITPVNSAVAPKPIAADQSAQNRELVRAVRTLNNDGSAGKGREFSIFLDPKSHQPVVRIIDAGTREVIDEVPSEYLLEVSRNLAELRSNNSGTVR